MHLLFVYFDLKNKTKENTLQVTTHCWAVFLVVKRELIFVFLISLTTERFLLKHRLYRSKVYGIKAKFLSFHRERGEAGEYCLRMFHIPTALPVLTVCSLLLSLFLNHSSLLCISPHFPPFSPSNLSFLPKHFSSIPTSNFENFPHFLYSPPISILSFFYVQPLLSYNNASGSRCFVGPPPPFPLNPRASRG